MIKAIYKTGVLEILASDEVLTENRELLLTIVKDNRTIKQNAYLWKVFEIIGNELGYDKDEIKVLILLHKEVNHTKTIINKKTGEEVIVPGNTHNLNKVEFSDLTEKIIRFAATLEINIQTPEEFLN